MERQTKFFGARGLVRFERGRCKIRPHTIRNSESPFTHKEGQEIEGFTKLLVHIGSFLGNRVVIKLATP